VTIVLASASPRRLTLLRQIGLDPLVRPSAVPEVFDASLTPEENARTLAQAKAADIAPTVAEGIVVGADTIVTVDGHLLAKPETPEEARAMLRLLSGRTHTVATGFALIERPSGRTLVDCETTRVTFRHLPEEELAGYVAGGSPMDKAGAYGIQDDYGAVFVTRIEGCYYNVVGLPLARFWQRLSELRGGRFI
jgi:septum formation protein